MRTGFLFAAAITMLALHADLAVAGGGSRHQTHAMPSPQHRTHQQGQHGRQAHTHFGGPRYEQRPDANNQNLYRPMFSLGATNPDGTHPYFRTRKEGFGYPPARPAPVYLGNGVYVIPR